MRREEFSHLDGKFWQRVRWECMHPIALMLTFIAEVVYLDHAGATLPARSQITQSMNLLTADFAANPHSLSTLGRRTHERVDRMRDLILRFANAPASQYSVVFTSGATAALKLVGECFPWSQGSEFCMLQDNHTSVVGIREYAVHGGAGCCSVLNLTPGVPQSAVGNAVPGTNVSSGVVLDVTPVRNGQVSAPNRIHTADDADRHRSAVVSGNTDSRAFSLFAFPAESNFSGAKYDMKLVHDAHDGRIGITNCNQRSDDPLKDRYKAVWRTPDASSQHDTAGNRWLVLMDAAKYASTDALDLTAYPADFVCVSFYKIFGFPTGVGALVVRNDAAAILRKRYFGGGSVEAVVTTSQFHVSRRNVSDRFEDGTINYASILALEAGFDLLYKGLGMRNVRDYLSDLTRYLYEGMRQLRHSNGAPVCVIYGAHHELWGRNVNKSTGQCCPSMSVAGYQIAQGAILACNLLGADGEPIGYARVDKLAGSLQRPIQLRTGCFCNAGACQQYLGLTEDDVKRDLAAGHVCWDEHDLSLDPMTGRMRPTGAVRLSLGYFSTREDVDAWIEFLDTYFVQHSSERQSAQRPIASKSSVRLSSIAVYPIKSCGPYSASSQWPLTAQGLWLYREWTVVTSSAAALGQKIAPALCLIRPVIDTARQLMLIQASVSPDALDSTTLQNLEIPLSVEPRDDRVKKSSTEIRVCGDVCAAVSYGGEVQDWFSTVLHRQCTLVRQAPSVTRKATARNNQRSGDASLTTLVNSESAAIGFANEGQYLLINQASVEALVRWTQQHHPALLGLSDMSPAGSSQLMKAMGNQGTCPDRHYAFVPHFSLVLPGSGSISCESGG